MKNLTRLNEDHYDPQPGDLLTWTQDSIFRVYFVVASCGAETLVIVAGLAAGFRKYQSDELRIWVKKTTLAYRIVE
jgi:hypothetical protein